MPHNPCKRRLRRLRGRAKPAPLILVVFGLANEANAEPVSVGGSFYYIEPNRNINEKKQKRKKTMRSSMKHILLGAVMAIVLICSLGFYDSWNWSSSTNRMTVTYDGPKVLTMYTTCASTNASTSHEPVVFDAVLTGAGQVGGRTLSKMYTNVALGQWANALKGYTEFGAAGSVSGLGSAIVAEMKLPGAALSRGSYAVSEIELVTTASGSYTSPIAMVWMQVSGNSTATGTWEDTGYIWIIKGLTDAAGNIFDTDTTPTCDATLRILVGSTPYYILLSNSPTS